MDEWTGKHCVPIPPSYCPDQFFSSYIAGASSDLAEIPAALEDVPLMQAPSLRSNRKRQESAGQIQQITGLMADVTED